MKNKAIKLMSGDVYQSQFGERVVVTGVSETEVFYMWKDGQGDVKSIMEFLEVYHSLGRREDMTHLFNALDPACDEQQLNTDKENIKIVLKEMSGAELISGSRAGLDMKGIAHADDWEKAYTVTLEDILGMALDMVPSVLWLVPEREAPKESVPAQEQNEQDVDQTEQEYDYSVFGTRVAGLLSEMGLAQMELADMVGVTNVSMARYIRGDRIPKAPIIANIAKALNTTTDYLFGLTDENGAEKPITMTESADEEVSPENEAEDTEIEDVECAREAAKHEAETCAEEPAEVPKEAKKESKWTTYDGNYNEENVKHTSLHDLGKWAEYQGKALSTSQQNMVIKGMKEEGYSVAVISNVVRLAQQTVYNRLSKMREAEKAGE